eukprot:s4025_g12.t3
MAGSRSHALFLIEDLDLAVFVRNTFIEVAPVVQGSLSGNELKWSVLSKSQFRNLSIAVRAAVDEAKDRYGDF